MKRFILRTYKASRWLEQMLTSKAAKLMLDGSKILLIFGDARIKMIAIIVAALVSLGNCLHALYGYLEKRHPELSSEEAKPP